jgi:imidazolonepropionase-like amidohydrolase
VVDSGTEYDAQQIIEGRGRLAVPGFIDTHTHLHLTLESARDVWPLSLNPDSAGRYRALLSEQYLQHGTTSIVDMGQSERYMDVSLNWQQNPSPHYPNIYVAGGAMISDEEREPFVSHVEIISPEAGKEKVRAYASQGVRHLKLYKWLREPEFKAVVEEARNYDLTLFGHIDNHVVTIQQAMDMGVIHFEHLLSVPASILTYRAHYDSLRVRYGVQGIGTLDEYAAAIMFFFEYMKDKPEYEALLLQLFERMAREEATLSTTIHVMGATAGKTSFFSSFEHYPEREEPLLPGYSDTLKSRLAQAFDTMMHFLKIAHEKGVKIRIGTDCKHGGRALLSELMLLYEAGFSVADILQIATWNGYEALGLLSDYGTISKGKKADLVIFEKDPFEDYTYFLSEKTVIKGGQIAD